VLILLPATLKVRVVLSSGHISSPMSYPKQKKTLKYISEMDRLKSITPEGLKIKLNIPCLDLADTFH
jgi:hypothetical protein